MHLNSRQKSSALAMARLLRSLLVSQGDPIAAQAFVEAKNWRDTPQVEQVTKALAVPLGTADQLIAQWLPASIELVEALQPLTVYGRLQPMMRRVPFRTSVVSASNDSQARFVGEYAGGAGQVIPVTRLDFDPATGSVAAEILNSAMLALIVVFTQDLIRRAPAGTDEFIAGELIRSVVKGMDIQFIDPSRNYDVARDAPASITADAVQHSSSGTALADVDDDLQMLIDGLIDNEMSLLTAHWIMSPRTAVSISRLRGSGGAPAYPSINARGGSLLGLPVLTSTACRAEGSPGESFIALAEAQEISYADDGAATIEYAQHASIQMDTEPSGSAQPMLNLWQNSLTAAKVARYVNWRARSGSTVVLRDVAY